MSVIGKKPFIKSLIESLTDEQLETLQTLIDGGGNQTPILRTMSDKPVGNRTNITTSDKGVQRCNLELEYSLFNGYLLYNNTYCVLIYYTDAQVLGMFKIDVAKNELENVTEALTIVELRSVLGGDGGGSGGGTTVEANPELEGTEDTLTGLQIGETKYKVPQPTTVEANPTLAGTEDSLSGIQIGNTKYKVVTPTDVSNAINTAITGAINEGY